MQIKRKVAAGGVVIRSTNKSVLETLLVQHADHKGWGFPKGHLDKKETPQAAALREVEEETGAIGEIIAPLPPTAYVFTNKKGRTIDKIVHWYLMRYNGQGNQTHAHEVADVIWCRLDDVPSLLTFQNDRNLFDAALPIIERSFGE